LSLILIIQIVYTVVNKGNSGTIDSVPFVINSACEAISDPTTVAGEYCMAYGPLSNYLLTIFSDTDIQRSTDYKFKQGMIARQQINVVERGRYTQYDALPLALPEGLSGRCDEYLGPDGVGFVLTFSVVTDTEGAVQETAVNVGPETYRNHDWQAEG
jgi:hypothetical protein